MAQDPLSYGFFQGTRAGFAGLEQQQQMAREARARKLQEQQMFLQGFETLNRIAAVKDRPFRNYLFETFAQRYTLPDGQAMFGPQAVESFKKMGEDTLKQTMQILEANKDMLAGQDPAQLATVLNDPLTAMEWIGKLGKISEQKQEMVSKEKGRQAWESIGGATDLEGRIANVQAAIQAAGAAGADTSKLQAHLNSLVSQREQQMSQRTREQQLAISQGHLAVSREELGLRKQAAQMAKSTNPAERYAAEMFDTSYGKLSQSQRAEVNQRLKTETEERIKLEGQARADVELENLRYTPVQQKQLTALNQSVSAAERLRSYTPETLDRWVGYFKNPLVRAQQLLEADPEFQTFQKDVARLKASLIFSREEGGGGALTPLEYENLVEFIPTGREPGGPIEFITKVDQLRDTLLDKEETTEILARAKPGEATALLEKQRQQSQARQQKSAEERTRKAEEARRRRESGGPSQTKSPLEQAMEEAEKGWKD